MNKKQLEKEILNLPPEEREHLALAAWESLETDTAFVVDHSFDPEGIDLALKRDDEIESGRVKLINHSEFKRITGGNSG